jgi:hypothetical protein
MVIIKMPINAPANVQGGPRPSKNKNRKNATTMLNRFKSKASNYKKAGLSLFMAVLLFGAGNYSANKYGSNARIKKNNTRLSVRLANSGLPSSMLNMIESQSISSALNRTHINSNAQKLFRGLAVIPVGNQSIPIAATALAELMVSDPASLAAPFSFSPNEKTGTSMEKSTASVIKSMGMSRGAAIMYQGAISALAMNPCPLWEFKRLSADEMYTIEIDQGPNPNGGMFGFGKNTRPKEIIQVGSFHQVLYKLNSLARAYKVQYGKPSSHYTGLLNLLKKNNKKTCNLEKKITDKQIEDMLKVITKEDLFTAARKIARLTQPSFFNQLESNMALYISRAVACMMVGFSVYMVARVDKGGAGKVAGQNFNEFVDQVIKKSGAKNANQAAAAALKAPLVAEDANAPQPCVAPTVAQQRKVAEGLRDKMDTVHKAAEAAVQELKVGNAAAVAVKNAGIAHRAANSARIAAINSTQPSKSLVNLAKNAANKAEAARKRANQLASGPSNRKLSNAEMKEINDARALANKAANNAKKAASNAAASKASAKSGGPPPPPPPQPPRMPPPPASARSNNKSRPTPGKLKLGSATAGMTMLEQIAAATAGRKRNAPEFSASNFQDSGGQKTANQLKQEKANALARLKKANENKLAEAHKLRMAAKKAAANTPKTPNNRSGNPAIAAMLAAGAANRRRALNGNGNGSNFN